MTRDERSLNGFRYRWFRSTALGWLLGLALIMGLAVLGDLVASGGGESQSIVGIGVGIGVGYAQGRTLRGWLGRWMPWTVASTVGMGALFVIHDIGVVAGLEFPFSLPLYVLAGALVTGLWQGVLLRPVTGRAHWWAGASVVGWGVPALCLALGDWSATGFLGDLASLCAIFLGGGMLGAASGGILRWILAQPRTQ
jgi:hypothetical protein